MAWGLVALTALLVACILAAAAAAAGIKRYTDNQGVIRISNTETAQPRKIPTDTPKTVAGAPETPKEVVALKPQGEPPSAAADQPIPRDQANAPVAAAKQNPGEQVSIPATPEKSLLYLPWEPKRTENVPPAQENREAARCPEAVTDPGPVPLQKVAFDPNAPGPNAALEPQAAASPKAESNSEGGIRRFRDPQGVLVIANVAAAASKTAPRLLQAENRGGPQKDFPEKQGDQPGMVPGAPNLRPASWSPDQPGVAPVPAASARITDPAAGGTIRRYRDKDGVIHIENVEPGAGETTSPPALQARAGPEEETGSSAPPGSSPTDETGPPAVVKPVAQSAGEEDKPPEQWLQTAASIQAEIGPQGAISRHRDRLGIWHIQTGKDPWILEASPFPRPVAGPREVLLAAVNLAARLPEVNRLPQVEVTWLPQITELPEVVWVPGPAVQTEPASSRNYGGITAARDRQGRLVITNAPRQAGIGHGPSWALASAQLEPIIQEAARAYQLPATLIRAVIKAESNFMHLAVSPKGAMGLMQLMPGTAQFLGVQEPFNPRENILGGCRYLRMLIDSFGGSLPLALAAYNAGPQRVVASGYRVPEITETQEFLTQVIGRYLMEEKKARSPWT